MIADALATAICVVGEERAARLLAAYPGAQAFLTRSDGTHDLSPLVPAEAGTQSEPVRGHWMPAFAGTERIGQAAACLPFGVTSAV